MPAPNSRAAVPVLPEARRHNSSALVDSVTSLQQALLLHASVTDDRAGQILVRARARADLVALVLVGVVAVTQERDGNTLVVELCGPGSLVGLEAISLGGRYSATATAVSSCRIGRVSASDFRAILTEDPQASRAVLVQAAIQLTDCMRTASQLRTGNGSRHVAWLLHEMLNKVAVRRSDGAFVLPFRISVTCLGRLAGVGREAASRAIGNLRRRGFVIKENGLFVVPLQSPLRPTNVNEHEVVPQLGCGTRAAPC